MYPGIMVRALASAAVAILLGVVALSLAHPGQIHGPVSATSMPPALLGAR